ncbi:MAG TPA: sulfite exporter TauE/SafE family protein [Pelomicrobium sp.]|nr:sulfite exporter TauE/SafE family protein [Pelomicrobium sp.]
MEWLLAYVAVGAFVGFFAGLLGIGGGMTMVPFLVFFFQRQDFPHEHIVHLALGTAMASILFTAISSVRAHHRRKSVNWQVAKAMAPGVLAGTFGGALVASALSTQALTLFFAVFVYIAATQLFVGINPKPTRRLPGPWALAGVGAGIGAVSSWVAAGGAVMTIPFLLFCNVPLLMAIGTSSALGFPIAAAGTAGYLITGLFESGLPDWSLGFVYLPALAGVVVASVLTAPIGASVAHRMPVVALRRVFAVFLYILATKMLSNLWA